MLWLCVFASGTLKCGVVTTRAVNRWFTETKPSIMAPSMVEYRNKRMIQNFGNIKMGFLIERMGPLSFLERYECCTSESIRNDAATLWRILEQKQLLIPFSMPPVPLNAPKTTTRAKHCKFIKTASDVNLLTRDSIHDSSKKDLLDFQNVFWSPYTRRYYKDSTNGVAISNKRENNDDMDNGKEINDNVEPSEQKRNKCDDSDLIDNPLVDNPDWIYYADCTLL